MHDTGTTLSLPSPSISIIHCIGICEHILVHLESFTVSTLQMPRISRVKLSSGKQHNSPRRGTVTNWALGGLGSLTCSGALANHVLLSFWNRNKDMTYKSYKWLAHSAVVLCLFSYVNMMKGRVLHGKKNKKLALFNNCPESSTCSQKFETTIKDSLQVDGNCDISNITRL